MKINEIPTRIEIQILVNLLGKPKGNSIKAVTEEISSQYSTVHDAVSRLKRSGGLKSIGKTKKYNKIMLTATGRKWAEFYKQEIIENGS